MMYASTPAPMDMTVKTAQMTRTTVGSTLKYSAMPAHTPAIMRFFDRVSFFCFVLAMGRGMGRLFYAFA